MKACEGMEVQLHETLTYALAGGNWSASYPLTPGERGCSTHYLWFWIEPRAVVEAMGKKYLSSAGDRIPILQPPARILVSTLELSRLCSEVFIIYFKTKKLCDTNNPENLHTHALMQNLGIKQ
jgi:hypothetical protein